MNTGYNTRRNFTRTQGALTSRYSLQSAAKDGEFFAIVLKHESDEIGGKVTPGAGQITFSATTEERAWIKAHEAMDRA